jgi:hypothetical protein
VQATLFTRIPKQPFGNWEEGKRSGRGLLEGCAFLNDSAEATSANILFAMNLQLYRGMADFE